MNIISVLERLTAPEFVASDVKILSRAEILRLQLKGEVTPISRIPREHGAPRESVPMKIGRGKDHGFNGKMRWR